MWFTVFKFRQFSQAFGNCSLTKRKLHSDFTCIHCSQCFKDDANLMRHSQNAINEDGILRNKCKVCDARFCTVVWLHRHSKEQKLSSVVFVTKPLLLDGGTINM